MRLIVSVVCLLFLASVSEAQLLNLATGQSPDLNEAAEFSIDGGLSLGDDGELFGARANFLAGEFIQVFGELGYLDLDNDFDGPAFGGGVFWQIPVDSALSVGVRTALDFAFVESGNSDIDLWLLTVLGVIGGETSVPELDWYANLGISRIDGEGKVKNSSGKTVSSADDSDTELQIGGGVTYAFSEGLSGFAGLDLIDDLVFGVGLRGSFE